MGIRVYQPPEDEMSKTNSSGREGVAPFRRRVKCRAASSLQNCANRDFRWKKEKRRQLAVSPVREPETVGQTAACEIRVQNSQPNLEFEDNSVEPSPLKAKLGRRRNKAPRALGRKPRIAPSVAAEVIDSFAQVSDDLFRCLSSYHESRRKAYCMRQEARRDAPLSNRERKREAMRRVNEEAAEAYELALLRREELRLKEEEDKRKRETAQIVAAHSERMLRERGPPPPPAVALPLKNVSGERIDWSKKLDFRNAEVVLRMGPPERGMQSLGFYRSVGVSVKEKDGVERVTLGPLDHTESKRGTEVIGGTFVASLPQIPFIRQGKLRTDIVRKSLTLIGK